MDRRRKSERLKSAASAEIGELPAVVNPTRKLACGLDLHLFLATYFPETTGADLFSVDHDRVIRRIEQCILTGGRFCNVVYRGFAKTTITERAALWAILYGYRQFVLLLGADKSRSKDLLDTILSEITTNELLLADFPEVCVAFRELGGKTQQAAAQTHGGERTHIKMTSETVVLPSIRQPNGEWTPSSGGVLKCRGLQTAVRGLKHARPDGKNVRPDFAIGDDPQTANSAVSPKQVDKRLGIIRKDVLKSSGHKTEIACVINATVMADNDLPDQLLDPERNPAWQGERIPMVRSWSKAHDTAWDEYAKLRWRYDRSDPEAKDRAREAATEFYRQRRAEMDEGCVVSWTHCFNNNEISAIQHAYNALYDDPPDVFESEYQNQPARSDVAGLEPLDKASVASRISGYARGHIPFEADHLTAMIDVHGNVLYWIVCAWRQDFTGWVVDYGTWPDQKRNYFSLRQCTKTLGRKYPGLGPEGARIKGLLDLTDMLCGRTWPRDQAPMKIGKLLIDIGWGSDQIEHVVRTSPHSAVLMASRGVGITASQCPMSEYKERKGRILGGKNQWYIEASAKRAIRIVRFDSNHWKTWLHQRLACPPTTPGSLLLFGDHKADHRLIADHLVGSEEVKEDKQNGRVVLLWDDDTNLDNHWRDGLVGCAVGASILGCSLTGESRKLGKSRRQRAIEAAKRKGILS